jgi:hypothetical protein
MRTGNAELNLQTQLSSSMQLVSNALVLSMHRCMASLVVRLVTISGNLPLLPVNTMSQIA